MPFERDTQYSTIYNLLVLKQIAEAKKSYALLHSGAAPHEPVSVLDMMSYNLTFEKERRNGGREKDCS